MAHELRLVFTFFRSDQSLSRVLLFSTPWIAARQASLSITNSRSSLRLTSIESVMPSSHVILCRPLLLLPPIPPSIRVFSNESTLRMKAKSKKDLMMHGQYMKFRFQCSQIKFVETQSPFRLAYLCIYCLCCFYIMTTGLRSFCRGLLASKD